MDLIQLSISKSFEEKGVYYFEIGFSFSSKQWLCKKRYNDFHELNAKLLVMYGSELPILPGKSFFSSSGTTAEKRKSTLESYLRDCIKIPTLIDTYCFQIFCDLQQNCPSILKPRPKLMGEFKQFTYQIYHMKQIASLNVILTAENQKGFGTYASSFFKTVFYGWLKKWKVNDKNELTLDLAFEIPFSHRITYLSADQFNNILIGLENGEYFIYDIDGKLIFNHKSHNSKVRGIEYLPERKSVISIEHDRNLIITDINKKLPISKLTISTHKLTLMKTLDKHSYIGDKGGEVRIYNIKQLPPLLLQCVKISPSPIKCISLDSVLPNAYIAQSNGTITVFEYKSLASSYNIKQLKQINAKCIVKSLSSIGTEMIAVGTKNGLIKYYSSTDSNLHNIDLAHSMPITSLQSNSFNLATCSKDKTVKLWNAPKEWTNKEIQKEEPVSFEKVEESKNIIVEEPVTLEKVEESKNNIIEEQTKPEDQNKVEEQIKVEELKNNIVEEPNNKAEPNLEAQEEPKQEKEKQCKEEINIQNDDQSNEVKEEQVQEKDNNQETEVKEEKKNDSSEQEIKTYIPEPNPNEKSSSNSEENDPPRRKDSDD